MKDNIHDSNVLSLGSDSVAILQEKELSQWNADKSVTKISGLSTSDGIDLGLADKICNAIISWQCSNKNFNVDWESIVQKLEEDGESISCEEIRRLWKFIAYGIKVDVGESFEESDEEDFYVNPDEAICRFETVSHSTTKKRLLRSDRADRPPFKKVKFLVPEQFFCGISNVTPYVLNSNSVYQPAMKRKNHNPAIGQTLMQKVRVTNQIPRPEVPNSPMYLKQQHEKNEKKAKKTPVSSAYISSLANLATSTLVQRASYPFVGPNVQATNVPKNDNVANSSSSFSSPRPKIMSMGYQKSGTTNGLPWPSSGSESSRGMNELSSNGISSSSKMTNNVTIHHSNPSNMSPTSHTNVPSSALDHVDRGVTSSTLSTANMLGTVDSSVGQSSNLPRLAASHSVNSRAIQPNQSAKFGGNCAGQEMSAQSMPTHSMVLSTLSTPASSTSNTMQSISMTSQAWPIHRQSMPMDLHSRSTQMQMQSMPMQMQSMPMQIQSMPMQSMPMQIQSMPMQSMPMHIQSMPMQSMPMQSRPKQSKPMQSMPTQMAMQSMPMPMQSMPMQMHSIPMSMKSMPMQSLPMPKKYISMQPKPMQSMPMQSMQVQSMPPAIVQHTSMTSLSDQSSKMDTSRMAPDISEMQGNSQEFNTPSLK